MTRFLAEDRADLDFTKPSAKQKTVVCPKCKTGQSVGKNWIAGQCVYCRKVFKELESLSKNEMERFGQKSLPEPNPTKMKLKGKLEKQAHEYKEKVKRQEQKGTRKSHEPGGKPRNW